MTTKAKGKELSTMQINGILQDIVKVDPDTPVKLILEISPYNRDTIEAVRKHGFEIEFEMPRLNQICGTIPAKRGSSIKAFVRAGTVKSVELCGMNPVEAM